MARTADDALASSPMAPRDTCASARLLLFAPCAILALAACGEEAPRAPRPIAKLWKDEGCATCHGANAEGTRLAPDLRDKATHWTREALSAYLKDPVGFASRDERLRAQMKGYSQAMPTYKMLSQAELDTLVEHVLSLRP
jgi:mono/diheme cytochrome c family protein